MSRFYSYVSTAVKAIKQYHGSEPFAAFLKKFFSADRKYGSKDRKMIAELCYAFFRVSHALSAESMEDKIMAARFLLQQKSDPLLAELNPAYNEAITKSLVEKCVILNIQLESIFPFPAELSAAVDKDIFYQSLLTQPDTFLRVRKDVKRVTDTLENAAIPYVVEKTRSLRLAHSVKLDDVFKINAEVVVQDLSSQYSLDGLNPNLFSGIIDVWDCCAASGGKSLLLHDNFKGKIRLSVSDVREKIIENLKRRMQQARVPLYRAFVADGSTFESEEPYDLILCDAPCTGSGTWARTPEQLHYFSPKKIREYSLIQQSILNKTWEALKPGGYYCYITCSVFTQENEAAVAKLQSLGGKLINQRYYTGYTKKADTLFTAVFQKI